MADPITKPTVEIPQRRGVPLTQTFAALKHRNYRLWFVGQLTSLVGTWMQNVAQPWLVYQLTGSPFYLGVVSFASAVPTLTLSLWAGVFIDRMSKRQLLLITQTVLMLSAFTLAADYFLGWIQPWHIVIMALVNGAAQAFDAPTRQSFVIEMVGRDDLMNAIALNSAMFNTARILGPTLAGIVLALVGAGWCFFLNGASFLAVIGGLLLMDVQSVIAARRDESPLLQIREGLGYIRHNKIVLTLLSMVAVANIFAFGYSALLPAFAQDVLHTGPEGLGLLSASVGIGALTGALIVASLGNSRRKGLLLTIGNVFFPTMVLAFASSRVLPLSMLILVGAGLGFMIQNTMTNTLIQFAVPDHLRGRVMSVYMLVFQGLFPIGSLMAGALAQQFSVPIGAAFGGTIALMAGFIWLWRAPYVRRLA
ncbi:Multidrug efflux pump Tap [Anaerolineae bacterium]|nr:Multidrug efflux pump Tap [Anaerolineae bacterium]